MTKAHFYLFWLVCIGLAACETKNKLRYETFQSRNGWGYNILLDGRIFIHQETVPTEPTLKGFATKTLAERTAQLVMKKLGHDEMPSLTKEEVAALQAKNQ